MIRIYEGCDGSGKSTKAQEDAKILGCEYIHNPVHWLCENPYEEWKKFFERYKGQTICVDRSFIGNPIYRTWDDGKKSSDFTDEQLKDLLEQEYMLIYCESGREYEDATSRGEDNLKTKEDYDIIKGMYHMIVKHVVDKDKIVYKYNWTTKECVQLKSNNVESLL